MLEEVHTMRNLLDFLAATAVILTLGAAPVVARAAGTDTSSPSPSRLVGHWVRDPRGKIVGSIWAIKGHDAVMLVGPMQSFAAGNRLVNVPLTEVRQTAGGVTLSNAGLAALGLHLAAA
jgi:hypothetical protein